jgi:hypothetical protein
VIAMGDISPERMAIRYQPPVTWLFSAGTFFSTFSPTDMAGRPPGAWS